MEEWFGKLGALTGNFPQQVAAEVIVVLGHGCGGICEVSRVAVEGVLRVNGMDVVGGIQKSWHAASDSDA